MTLRGTVFDWIGDGGMNTITVTAADGGVWVETCAHSYHGDATFLCKLGLGEVVALRDALTGILNEQATQPKE